MNILDVIHDINPTITLCANCGCEIGKWDESYEVGDEIWCEHCAAPMFYPEGYDDE